MTAPGPSVATVTGRWVGTNRVQVRLQDGSSAVVESSRDGSDEVDIGDTVEVDMDGDGRPADWRRGGG